jgi:hypothetical protein
LSDFKPGDLVEIIDNSNGDSEKGAVAMIWGKPGTEPKIEGDGDNQIILCRFADYGSWWVRPQSLKKLSRLFPKPITNTDGTPA